MSLHMRICDPNGFSTDPLPTPARTELIDNLFFSAFGSRRIYRPFLAHHALCAANRLAMLFRRSIHAEPMKHLHMQANRKCALKKQTQNKVAEEIKSDLMIPFRFRLSARFPLAHCSIRPDQRICKHRLCRRKRARERSASLCVNRVHAACLLRDNDNGRMLNSIKRK